MSRQTHSSRYSTDASAPYRVGAARADITPRVGARLGGYGARQGVSDRVGAPLSCTAFAFNDGTTTVCLVTCDLLYITTDIRDAVRRVVATRTHLPGEAVMLVATHTHSGPADLTAQADEQYLALLAERIAGAVERAIRSAQPAIVRISTARLSGISQNRRDPDGPVENLVRTIIAESTKDRRTLAVLINYACHPTVLEADSLAISPDFPGAAVALVETTTGATAGYLQGCAGAINPVWIDHTADEVARVGSVLGSVAIRQIYEGQGPEHRRRTVNLSRLADVVAPDAPHAGDVVSGQLWHGTGVARLRRRPIRPVREIDDEISACERVLGPADDWRGTARLAALRAERFLTAGGFRYWPAGDPAEGSADAIDIPAIGFGSSLAFLGIPGEPFLEIGESLRRRSPLDHLVVCGYANETVGYLPTRQAFAQDGYEVGMARYTPGAAERIIDAGTEVLRKYAR